MSLLVAAWVAVGILGLFCTGLMVAVLRQGRRTDAIATSQRALIQQLEAVHSAQLAYAEATEEALTNLRDGLQTLTTVSANLDMKAYALELQQARLGQRMKQQQDRERRSPTTAPPVSELTRPASFRQPSAAPVAKQMTPPNASHSSTSGERELLAALQQHRARVA